MFALSASSGSSWLHLEMPQRSLEVPYRCLRDLIGALEVPQRCLEGALEVP